MKSPYARGYEDGFGRKPSQAIKFRGKEIDEYAEGWVAGNADRAHARMWAPYMVWRTAGKTRFMHVCETPEDTDPSDTPFSQG